MPDTPAVQPADQWPGLKDDERDYYRMVFVTGDMSLIALCRRYSLGYESVKKYAQRHDWMIEREKYRAQFADNESLELQKILADVRRVLLNSFRSVCLWYQEQLHYHELNNTVHEFPLDQWSAKLNVFIDLVDKVGKLSGVSREALIQATVNNTQVNIGHPTRRENGGNPELDGPPGVQITDETARGVVSTILTEVMRKTRPVEVTVEAEHTGGVR